MNYISYIVTAISITGTIANSFKKRWCFYLWICTNTFWSIYNLMLNQYAQSLLYLFNLIMAVVGLFKWKKEKK